MSERTPPPGRESFRYFTTIPTRWMDNDVYGHVNNVVYYSYFDTLIANFLMNEGGLDPRRDPVIAYAVENACRFHAPLRYPDRIEAGLAVSALSNRSAVYAIGLFREGEASAAASGRFAHVFVDRASERPAPIPARIREALRRIASD